MGIFKGAIVKIEFSDSGMIIIDVQHCSCVLKMLIIHNTAPTEQVMQSVQGVVLNIVHEKGHYDLKKANYYVSL